MSKICLNLSLPHYQNILTKYGENVGLELISYLTSNKFIDWYGSETFPSIYNDIITNSKGEQLFVIDTLSFTKSLFKPSVVNKVEKQLNNVSPKDIIEQIKSKRSNLTEIEKRLMSGKISIDDFFKSTNKTYIPDTEYNNDDKLFEVFHKLEMYADDKYKPLIKFIKTNIGNYEIKFDTIDTLDNYITEQKLIGSEFYGYYDPVTNTIKMNKYLFNKDDKNFNYNNPEFNAYILHELLHALTTFRFNNDDTFRNKMNDLLEYIKSNMSSNDLQKFSNYLDDSEELITWSFHDSDFQIALSKIPIYSKNVSVYQNFIDNIKAFINIDKPGVIDDVFHQTLDTIYQQKVQTDLDAPNITDLKSIILKKNYPISNDQLNDILQGLKSDWLNFKTDYNFDFNNYKNQVIEKLDNCLL